MTLARSRLKVELVRPARDTIPKRKHRTVLEGGVHENVLRVPGLRLPDLRGYSYDPAGERLPRQYGPWTLIQQIGPDEEWTEDVSRAVVAGGILDNGFYLWGPVGQSGSSKPIIESDRVEGTAVFNPR